MSCLQPLPPQKERTCISEQELIKITWAPTWELEVLLHERKSLKRRVSEYVSLVQASKDTSYDKLERQGFDIHPNPSKDSRRILTPGKPHKEM